jgi:Tol biopolymer transport system component
MTPGRWVNGWLYFTGARGQRTNLWRLPMDAETRKVDGDPELLPSGSDSDYSPSVSADGTIYFTRMGRSVNLWSAPLAADEGRVKGDAVALTTDDATAIRPSLSSDGEWMAYTSDKSDEAFNVWLRNTGTGAEEQITANTRDDFTPTGVVSPNGDWLAYTVYEEAKSAIYARRTTGGEPVLVCSECETPRDWSADGRNLLYSRSARNFSIGRVERSTGLRTTLTQSDKQPLLLPRYSPDNNWIAFHALESPEVRKVFVMAVGSTSSAKEREWIPVTGGRILDRGAQWSPDGNLLYFMSERDGFRNIYAQRLNAETKQPQGDAFIVYRSRDARRSLLNVPIGLSEVVVVPGQIIFNMGELSGNLFEMQLSSE